MGIEFNASVPIPHHPEFIHSATNSNLRRGMIIHLCFSGNDSAFKDLGSGKRLTNLIVLGKLLYY